MHRRRIVLRQIRDAQSATEVDDRDLRVLSTPNSATTSRSRPITRCAASSKPATSKICEPMWLCRPTRRRLIGREHAAYRGHRRAAGQRQAELLVLVGGGDELVGVRLDADGDAHEHVLHDAGRTGDRVEAFDLGHRVEHDVPDAGLDGRGQLVDGFVVAVQRDSLGREVGVQRDGEFAATADVQRQALLVDPARHLGAQERLGGVVHVARRRRRRRRSRGSASGSRPRR